MLGLSRTAVRVDDPGLLKTHSEVVQHGGLVQVAEGGEVILSNQDVRVAKRRQLGIGRVDGVEAHLQGQRMASASLYVTVTESLSVSVLTEPLSRRSSRALSPGRKSRVISADLHTC